MGKARNGSRTGLQLLDAQTRVALNGTPHHQDALRWYAPLAGDPPRQVEVELVPAPLWSAEQAGWWGLEVRIDGFRVGELVHPMAGWYGPHVDQVLDRGERPGAEAHVVFGDSGLIEVDLYLPVADAPLPAVEPDDGGRRPIRGRVPLWMGVAAGVLLLAMVAGVAFDRITRSDPVTASPATPTPVAVSVPVAPSSAAPPAPQPAAAPSKPRPKPTAKRVVAAPKPKPAAVPRTTVPVTTTPTPTTSPTTKKPTKTTSKTTTSEPTEETSTKPTKEPTKEPTEEPTEEPDSGDDSGNGSGSDSGSGSGSGSDSDTGTDTGTDSGSESGVDA